MTPVDDLSDDWLVEQLRTGDRHALALIYDRYKGRLYAFCMRLLRDDAQAQDAVHETFLNLFRTAATLEHGGALKTWLYRTARNEGLQLLRRNGRRADTDPETLRAEDTPLSLLDAQDTATVVRKVLHHLKREYMEVLMLREFEDLSYAQIAEITLSTESAVKSRIFKARLALATRLAPWFAEGRSK